MVDKKVNSHYLDIFRQLDWSVLAVAARIGTIFIVS